MFTSHNKSHSSKYDRENPPNRFCPQFPKGTCWPFTQEKPARAVNSSTFVSNVGPVILPANAPLTKANPKLHSLANKLTGLSHLPITPVRAHRLQFFLANYPPHLSSFLLNGFRFGFSIQFHGERKPFESPNLLI